MPRRHDIVLLAATGLLLLVTAIGVVGSSAWIDQPFPGFLLLENKVVASAGLSSWPATRESGIYQHQVVAVDGRPLSDARWLREYASSLPVGSELRYRLRRGDHEFETTIATRRFTTGDFILLFGAYLVCGLGLAGMALTIRFLRGRDPLATGSVLALWIIGLWAISATDLYGPYHLFRLHALLECFLFAGATHFALVFPYPRQIVIRRPWLVAVPYALASLLALVSEFGLYQPDVYVTTHLLAMLAFGGSLALVIGSQLWAYLHPPDHRARQRVKVVALGSVAALGPHILIVLTLATSGGQTAENVMGWSGIFFPIAIGYAILRQDLLQVDAILRRSLNYAILTAFLAVAYIATAAGFDALTHDQTVVSRSTFALLFAGATVMLLLPMRDYFQSTIDRLFFRSAYDFRRLVQTSSQRLASVAELDEIAGVIERAVGEALHPEWISIEVRRQPGNRLEHLYRTEQAPECEGETLRVADQSLGPFSSDDRQLAVPFRVEDRLLALLRLGPRLCGSFYGGQDRALLQVLANQGAVAIENALALERLRDLNRNLERKVDERTAELTNTLDELRKAQDCLVHQEKMASLGQLVAGIAHEINNPVNFIQGNLHFIRQYTSTLAKSIASMDQLAAEHSSELREALDRIREDEDLAFVITDLDSTLEACDEGVRRTTGIVQGLRTFSRMEDAESEQIDIHETLDSTLTLLRSRLSELELVKQYGELPPVECLPGQIGQVLMNLLSNAVDAVGPAGTITVRTRLLESDRVRVEIEDNGCGIEPEKRDHIFEPFFTTKPVGDGTGLGLAITYGVVVQHGGTISVRSELGCGTCFELDLPIRYSPPTGRTNDPEGSSEGQTHR